MRLVHAILTAAILSSALPAAAEDGAVDDWQDITVEEWREMVLGRTVTYRIGPQVWAQEAYDVNSNAVAIRLADGTCMEGTWTHLDNVYCFAWIDTETSCFRHVRDDGEILVIPIVDGEPSGAVQTVAGVSDLPLACGPNLSS